MKKCWLILVITLLLCACAPKEQALPTATVPTGTIPTVTESVIREGIPVETPCGTVYLPDVWDLPITVETSLGEPMRLSFLAEGTPLYELTFSKAPDGAIGMLQTDSGVQYLGVTLHPLEEESDLLLSMQESVNELLFQLDPQPVAPADAPPDILIQTPYGTLPFPGKWEGYLRTEQPEADTLDFYCDLLEHPPVLLFTAVFGTAEGGIRADITADDGTVTPLIFLRHTLVFEGSWSQEALDLVYAMQEELNFLLDALES